MDSYYVNKNAQSNGDHEVHKSDCVYIPNVDNRINLGEHSNCKTAVVKAKENYSRVNGCKSCCNDCHTS